VLRKVVRRSSRRRQGILSETLSGFKEGGKEMTDVRSIFALDPGPKKTAWFEIELGNQFCKDPYGLWAFGETDNLNILHTIPQNYNRVVVCEEIASFGMPVGAETFETVRWEGEYRHLCRALGIEFQPVKRHDIKMHHCHSARASDANIHQALIDRFGKKGTKKNPGKTFGISGKDVWSAFSIAIYWFDRNEPAPQVITPLDVIKKYDNALIDAADTAVAGLIGKSAK
jgi:hypothetical protein